MRFLIIVQIFPDSRSVLVRHSFVNVCSGGDTVAVRDKVDAYTYVAWVIYL